MKTVPKQTVRTTHFIAAEINRAMAAADMTIAELAAKAVQSEAFIRQLLEGEDGLGRLVNVNLLQSIADATGKTITIKILPIKRRTRKASVESTPA